MTDDQSIDQRLREYGDRWRAALEPPATVDANRLAAPQRGRRAWWVTGAAAAAVLAVIAGAELTDRTPASAPPPQERVRSGGVVPWAPLKPTHPQLSTVTIPASPDPAEALQAPPCRASDLRAEREMGAAAGTTYLNVRLVLTGNTPCTLEGFARVQPMDNGQPVDIPVARAAGRIYSHPVLVANGQPAVLTLSWISNWCAPRVNNDSIRAVLPGGAGALTFAGFGRTPFCNSGSKSGPVPIVVRPFQSQDHRPAIVRSPYRSVRVSGDLTRTVAPGQVVRFTVTLMSAQRLVLDPCPDYTITQYDFTEEREERFALNCAAVPYRDANALPYLPAHTPVRFAMQTTAGKTDAPKFNWNLVTPNDNVSIGGQLTVK